MKTTKIEKKSNPEEKNHSFEEIFAEMNGDMVKYEILKNWNDKVENLLNNKEKCSETAAELLPETVSNMKALACELISDVVANDDINSLDKVEILKYLCDVADMAKKVQSIERTPKKLEYMTIINSKDTMSVVKAEQYKEQLVSNGWKALNDDIYIQEHEDGSIDRVECEITYETKEEHLIKTFISEEDAIKWCEDNGTKGADISSYTAPEASTVRYSIWDIFHIHPIKEITSPKHIEYLVDGYVPSTVVSVTKTESTMTPVN